MAETYEAIATTTLGSTATAISFTSIPSTYTDLRVILVTKLNSGSGIIRIYLNNNSSNIYSYTSLYNQYTSPASDRTTSSAGVATNYSLGSYFSFIDINIFDYANTGKNTSMLVFASDDQLTSVGASRHAALLWRDTSAVNRVDLQTLFSDPLAVGTTATLYGIKKA